VNISELLSQCGIDVDLGEILEGKKAQISCPLAPYTHERSHDANPSSVIALNPDTNELYFHCFTCKTSGTLGDLVFDFADYSGDRELARASLKAFPELNRPHILQLTKLKKQLLSLQIPKEIPKQVDHSESFTKRCSVIMRGSRSAKYLKKRHVESDVSRQFGLQYDRQSKRIVIPIYSRDGKLLTAVGRALLDNQIPKYYNYYTAPTGTVLGGLHLFENQSRVVLVEGFFDMLNLARFSTKILPMCCFGARLTDEQAMLVANLYYRKSNKPKFQITIMYDGDTAGRSSVSQAANKLLRRGIPESSINVVWLPPDLDPGSLKEDEYFYYLERALTWQRRRKKHGKPKQASSLNQLQKLLQHGS